MANQITQEQEFQLIQEPKNRREGSLMFLFPKSCLCLPRLWQESTDGWRDPQLSSSQHLPYRFSFSFFLSNYRLSNLCFLVNAPQSVSQGLSDIRVKLREGVSKHLRAHRSPESPFLGSTQSIVVYFESRLFFTRVTAPNERYWSGGYGLKCKWRDLQLDEIHLRLGFRLMEA